MNFQAVNNAGGNPIQMIGTITEIGGIKLSKNEKQMCSCKIADNEGQQHSVTIFSGNKGLPTGNELGKPCLFSINTYQGQKGIAYSGFFNGQSAMGQAQLPIQQMPMQRPVQHPQQQPQAGQKDTYWKDKAAFDIAGQLQKNRGVALSYALKLVEMKVGVFGDTTFWGNANLCLAYIQDGVPHKQKQEIPSFDSHSQFEQDYNIPPEPENGPDYSQEDGIPL